MGMKTYLVIFATVFLAELGDKTQLATLLFASEPATSKFGVFIAATAALTASTLLAVLIGERLGEWVTPGHLRILAGAGFIAIGIWTLLRA